MAITLRINTSTFEALLLPNVMMFIMALCIKTLHFDLMLVQNTITMPYFFDSDYFHQFRVSQ